MRENDDDIIESLLFKSVQRLKMKLEDSETSKEKKFRRKFKSVDTRPIHIDTQSPIVINLKMFQKIFSFIMKILLHPTAITIYIILLVSYIRNKFKTSLNKTKDHHVSTITEHPLTISIPFKHNTNLKNEEVYNENVQFIPLNYEPKGELKQKEMPYNKWIQSVQLSNPYGILFEANSKIINDYNKIKNV